MILREHVETNLKMSNFFFFTDPPWSPMWYPHKYRVTQTQVILKQHPSQDFEIFHKFETCAKTTMCRIWLSFRWTSALKSAKSEINISKNDEVQNLPRKWVKFFTKNVSSSTFFRILFCKWAHYKAYDIVHLMTSRIFDLCLSF